MENVMMQLEKPLDHVSWLKKKKSGPFTIIINFGYANRKYVVSFISSSGS